MERIFLILAALIVVFCCHVAPVCAEEGPAFQPVFPRYPYHAGHYPRADSYYDLPPYADISPSWWRWRYFLTLREGGRYRYVPFIFTRHNYRAP
jgi:hypothetical protein